ncbi:unnamed protein product, partial [marine sediment metagenome]
MTRRETGTKWQGSQEECAYKVDTTTWGGYDSDATVRLMYGGDDVSETHLSGELSVSGDVITTPLVVGLSAGIKYSLHIG